MRRLLIARLASKRAGRIKDRDIAFGMVERFRSPTLKTLASESEETDPFSSRSPTYDLEERR